MARSYTEIMAEAQIKPSLFNKYKRLGLLPRPEKVDFRYKVGCTAYYPDDIVDRIRQIQELKAEGKTLAQIKDELNEAVPIYLVDQEFIVSPKNDLEAPPDMPPEMIALMSAVVDLGLTEWVERKRLGYTLASVEFEVTHKDGQDFYRPTKIKIKPKEQ